MKITKILVPVKGESADDEAVQLACITAKHQRARVLILHVIEIRRAQPLESENPMQIEGGEKVLEHALQVAKNSGAHVETELLQARVVGPVLLDEAKERGVDLIVMGVPFRPPIEEFYLGTAVRYLLKNAICPVWLCRQEALPTKVEEKKN